MIPRWLASTLALTGLAGASVLVGALTADASVAVTATQREAAIHVCPDAEPIGALRSQDRVVLTGRDPSGGWLQLRAPHDPAGRVWIRAEAVVPDDEVRGLDVVDCLASDALVAVVLQDGDEDEPLDVEVEETEPSEDDDLVIAAPDDLADPDPEGPSSSSGGDGANGSAGDTSGGGSTGGGSTGGGSSGGGSSGGGSSGGGSSGGGSSGGGSSPTPGPTDPDPPPGTPDPEPPAPTVGSLSRTQALIVEESGMCPVGTVHTSAVTAQVDAPAGVQSVTLHYGVPKDGGGTYSQSKPMSLSAGLWRATVGPVPHETVNWQSDHTATWSVTAVDQLGRSVTTAAGGGQSIVVRSGWSCFG